MQVNRYAIFGGGGGGEIVAEYLVESAVRSESIGFLNDAAKKGEMIGAWPVLGSFSQWSQLSDETHFLAPLHKAKYMPQRSALIESLGIPLPRWGRAIHPNCAIATSACVANGSSVGPFVELQPHVRLGIHVAIRSGATIGHDSILEDYVFVGTKAVVSGYCRIGRGAHVAPNSTIRENLELGRYSVIGLGSVVTRDVPPYAVMAGSPARQVGELAPKSYD